MRIWSLHPGYLDAKGLVATWRETLLAQKVLQGKTRGYIRHPQLQRFKTAKDPLKAISAYLHAIADEADSRNYHFDRSKILFPARDLQLEVTLGQIQYEFNHLLTKLSDRDPARYEKLKSLKQPDPHPLFKIVPGGVAAWEVTH